MTMFRILFQVTQENSG